MMPQIVLQDMNLTGIGFNKAGSGGKAETGGKSFGSFLTSHTEASGPGTAIRQLTQQPPEEGMVPEGLEADSLPGETREGEPSITGTSIAVVPELVLLSQAGPVTGVNFTHVAFTVHEGSFPASSNAAPAGAFQAQSSPTQQPVMVDGLGPETVTLPVEGKDGSPLRDVFPGMKEMPAAPQAKVSLPQRLPESNTVADTEFCPPGSGELKETGVFREESQLPKAAGLPKKVSSSIDQSSTSMEKSSTGKLIPKDGAEVPERAVNAPADSLAPGDRTSLKDAAIFHGVKGKSDQLPNSGNSQGESSLSFGNPRELGFPETGSARSVPPFPEEPFLNRLSQVIRDHVIAKSELIARQGRTEIRLELKPEYLGKLFLRLSMENGTVHAKFLVENQQVRSLIENHLSQLKQNLADQGIVWQEAHVDVGGSGRGFSYEEGPQAESRLFRFNPDCEESVEAGEIFYPLDRSYGRTISYLA